VRVIKKKTKLFEHQQEGEFHAIVIDGNKFVFFPTGEKVKREVSAKGSFQGAGGAYASKKEIPKYDGFVILSGSTKPIPLDKWREQAFYALRTASGGEAIPDQLGSLNFSFPITPSPSTPWKPWARPPSEYIKSRIRKGLEMYRRGGAVPDVNIAFVPSLANSTFTGDKDYQPAYHPISDEDVMFELKSMVNHGELRVEADKIRLS